MADEETGQESDAPMFSSTGEAEKAYKNLQRQLTKAQQIAKETMVNRFVVDDLAAQVYDLTETVKTSANRDYGTDEEDNPFNKLDKRGELRQVATTARRSISEMMIQHGEDFSDPQFDTARGLYESGRYDEAVTAVRAEVEGSQGGARSDEVAALVTEELRKRGVVDSGNTSGGGGVIPRDPEQLRIKLADKAWVREHRKDLLEAHRAGRI